MYNTSSTYKFISSSSKNELEMIMLDHFIPPQVSVRESSINGRGVFANEFIPIGTKFEMFFLFKSRADEYKNYVWRGGQIIAGIGYFANGSSPILEEHSGESFGNFIAKKVNIVANFKDRTFDVIKDIKKDEELILNYGDGYFFEFPNGKIDITKVRQR